MEQEGEGMIDPDILLASPWTYICAMLVWAFGLAWYWPVFVRRKRNDR